jgi:hypothetical protein
MKTIKAFVVAAFVVSSFPILAQQADADMQQSTSASTPGTQVNQSASGSASASRHGIAAQGSGSAGSSNAVHGLGSTSSSANGSATGAAETRPVSGELVGKLDSKTAKVGDPVILKTTGKARTADGTEIPKGSRLIGHVTDVQAHGHGNQDSRLGLEFDHAELRNGQSMAIHSVIESVSPSPAAASAAAAGSDDMFAGAPAGGGFAAGGTRSSGGLVGGARGVAGGTASLTGGAVNSAGSAAGNAGAGVGSTTGGALSATGNTALNAGNGTLRGAAAGTGSLAAESTGIPGVMLGGAASGEVSGMLSASKKNVHLDSGTQMVLGVSSAASR